MNLYNGLLCLSILMLTLRFCDSFQVSLLSKGRTSKSIPVSTSIQRDRYAVSKRIHGNSRDDLLKVQFVQAAFAAGCAFAVFNYVWNNIDEIKVCLCT